LLTGLIFEGWVSTAILEVPIKRQATFFLWRIFAITIGIAIISFLTSAIPQTELASRLNVNAALVSALVIILIVVHELINYRLEFYL
jgi:hypothetical protein